MFSHMVGRSAIRESIEDELEQPTKHSSSNSIKRRLSNSIGKFEK